MLNICFHRHHWWQKQSSTLIPSQCQSVSVTVDILKLWFTGCNPLSLWSFYVCLSVCPSACVSVDAKHLLANSRTLNRNSSAIRSLSYMFSLFLTCFSHPFLSRVLMIWAITDSSHFSTIQSVTTAMKTWAVTDMHPTLIPLTTGTVTASIFIYLLSVLGLRLI